MEELLRSYCRQLRLGSNIVSNAKKIKTNENIQFLVQLFKLEIEMREMKRKNTYIKQAKFDVLKTFEDYSFEDIKYAENNNHR